MDSRPATPDSDRQPAHSPPFWETIRQRYPKLKPYLWQRKIGPAFWSVASVFSLLLNVVLIVMLVLVGREVFGLKQLVREQLIDGLHSNFKLMDQAVIAATVPVDDMIPVRFLLPVETTTRVVLTEDTLLRNARVDLATGGLSITDAPTDIVLKAGTELPVELNIDVPVDTTIPVHLEVAVEIPLNETDLHAPFVGLQDVVSPYNDLLSTTPDSWDEALCRSKEGLLCRLLARSP